MKLSELITKLTVTMAAEGDVNVFRGDMEPLTVDDLTLHETTTTDPDERAQYGEKYLHIGEW